MNFDKLILTGIFITLMGFFSTSNADTKIVPDSQVPLTIEETINETNILTYEQALELAERESLNLKNNLLSAESTEVVIGDNKDEIGYSMYNPAILASLKLDKNDKLNSEKTERMDEYIKEGLAFTVKSIFYNIDTISNDIGLQEEKILNQQQKKQIVELKLKYGMESQTNLTLKQLEIDQLIKDKETMAKDLQDQYFALNKLLGFDQFKVYHIEALPINYEPLKDTAKDVELKTSRTISKDITIWGKEQQLDIQRIGVDFYALNFISGFPSDQQANPTPLEAQKLDVRVAANEIEQAKKDAADAVATKYNNIKKLEATKESAEVRLMELLERKRTLEAALNAGTVIEQDYRDLLLGIKEIRTGIEKIESQHVLLKEMYNNPLLAAGNVN